MTPARWKDTDDGNALEGACYGCLAGLAGLLLGLVLAAVLRWII